MDYSKLYNGLISFRTINPLKKSKDYYTEVHHIVPRCLGGDNSKGNLIRLTGREHFIAHRLLAKIHPDNHELRLAALFMSRNEKFKNSWFGSRLYEIYRIEHAASTSKQFTGRVVSPEERLRVSKFMKGRYVGEDNPFFGMEHSQETKDKISAFHIGRESPNKKGQPRSEKDRAAIAAGTLRGEQHPMKRPEVAARHSMKMKGKKFSEGHKQRISESNSAVWLITDPFGHAFEYKGPLEQFCKINDISRKMLEKSIERNGALCIANIQQKTQQSKDTVGWGCKKLSGGKGAKR
ncbi:MAG: NUMOD3 domain-containing DNA-binding protein [Aeromonas popoffii]|uniref:NUMOD3 domain-containing DNA-binding protein n=1 Tax=Aeromonas popoffii TaxID=70856 RepID=UPI003F2C9AF4